MKRHSFVVLRLLMLIVLGASLNACMISNYQITAQEPKEGRTSLASKDDDRPIYFVIPQHYRVHIGCKGNFPFPSTCREYPDFLGTQIYKGLSAALYDIPLGKPIEFTEHIWSQGFVCVVTVNEQLSADIPYSEILSLVTLFTVPAYTTRKYVLNYSLLLDFKTVKEYEYHIAEKAITGWVSWMLFPAMYPFWSSINVDLRSEVGPKDGPPASVIREITKTFLLEARRDGIL
jgi:hypothetical protein